MHWRSQNSQLREIAKVMTELERQRISRVRSAEPPLTTALDFRSTQWQATTDALAG